MMVILLQDIGEEGEEQAGGYHDMVIILQDRGEEGENLLEGYHNGNYYTG